MKTNKTAAPKKRKTTNKPFARRFPERASASAKKLAANVRRLRKERGLTQREVGRLLGVDQAAVSLIELKRSNPTLRMLDAIADLLGVTSAELLSEAKLRSAKSD